MERFHDARVIGQTMDEISLLREGKIRKSGTGVSMPNMASGRVISPFYMFFMFGHSTLTNMYACIVCMYKFNHAVQVVCDEDVPVSRLVRTGGGFSTPHGRPRTAPLFRRPDGSMIGDSSMSVDGKRGDISDSTRDSSSQFVEERKSISRPYDGIHGTQIVPGGSGTHHFPGDFSSSSYSQSRSMTALELVKDAIRSQKRPPSVSKEHFAKDGFDLHFSSFEGLAKQTQRRRENMRRLIIDSGAFQRYPDQVPPLPSPVQKKSRTGKH
jgi:hypothetical protein